MLTTIISYGLICVTGITLVITVFRISFKAYDLFVSKQINVRIVSVEPEDSPLSYRKYKYKVEAPGLNEFLYLHGYRNPWIFTEGEVLKCYYSLRTSSLYPSTFKGKTARIIVWCIFFIAMVMGILTLLDSIEVSIVPFLTKSRISGVVVLCIVTIAVVMLIDKLIVLGTFIKNSVKVKGQIIGNADVKTSDNEMMKSPIVEFFWEGNKYTFISDTSSNNERPTGVEVIVIFHRAHPFFAEVDSFITRWAEIFFWSLIIISGCIYLFMENL